MRIRARSTALAGAAAATAALAMLGGCSSAAEFTPCPDGVDQVEIFNTYADHNAADRHLITGEDAATFCATAFPYNRLPRRSFTPAELEQRRVTVLRFSNARDEQRTLWAYGLAGYDSGTAIVLDDGTSYHLPNRGLLGYYAADAAVIPRSAVPQRS